MNYRRVLASGADPCWSVFALYDFETLVGYTVGWQAVGLEHWMIAYYYLAYDTEDRCKQAAVAFMRDAQQKNLHLADFGL